MTVTNSILSGNSADFHGGGSYNEDGVMTVTNSTLCVRRSESAALIGQKVQRSGLKGSILIGLGVGLKEDMSLPHGGGPVMTVVLLA